jgi:4-alpha-glucanotransferase
MKQRRAGLMVPLFSLVSSRSWGIGEYPDLATFARWADSAGQSFVQILPITELPESETSPYSALTAMAIDPIFIALPALEDFEAIGGEARLPHQDRTTLDAVRSAPRVAYSDVRGLKSAWLRRAFEHFRDTELQTESQRGREFRTFTEAHAGWLEGYALFRAIRQEQKQSPWWEWPEGLARLDAHALRQAAESLADEITYRKYLQWVAAGQWSRARRDAAPVAVFGDVPFMISADSPDVWARQQEFRFDGTVGVPPDAFSDTGQDWGLPPWRWDVMAANDFAWMRMRAERTAELFDGFRLDHLVGLYRTYIRPLDKSVEPFFAPETEREQEQLGERLVALYAGTGAEVIAEDLGTVPDFVRASLTRLGVPGFKVMRWERQWNAPAQPYIDPADYPRISVATTGTHDTEPLVTWWKSLDPAERETVLQMPSVARYVAESAGDLDALIRGLLSSASYLSILPLQDLFAWPDRINTPAQVGDDNWTWMLPWRADQLTTRPESRDRARQVAEWTRAADR